MPEKVELAFKQFKTKEKPKDLIVRYFSERFIGTDEAYEIYPDGASVPEMAEFAEKIYGVYQKTFYLSDKRLIIVRPNGGLHILEFFEVDREFFTISKYPNPNNLWELLDTLKWKSLKGYKFTGPPQVRQFVKNLSPDAREVFQLKLDPHIWQATICCKCNYDIFRIHILGETDSEGLLHCTENGSFRVELSCQYCGRTILLFDPTLHGYNAMIDELSPPPTLPRQAKTHYECQCSNNTFQVAVAVFYDANPATLASFTIKERNNSYGWFYAFLKCAACNRLINFVDYECA